MGCVLQPISCNKANKLVVDWLVMTKEFHNPCRALKLVGRR